MKQTKIMLHFIAIAYNTLCKVIHFISKTYWIFVYFSLLLLNNRWKNPHKTMKQITKKTKTFRAYWFKENALNTACFEMFCLP